ncbi:TauD/TfdA family dioxygenase [Amycolatopsis rubida]|uniref:TauD/TfdA family dioxygenase n=1 Tax=Amycolatopsis rubida TaxID=112413 RepID=UPI00136C7DC9|nr:TauD/TfdA family dioxygenase [Amycolatopsis rubida]
MTVDAAGRGVLSVARPTVPTVDLAAWLKDSKPQVQEILNERGAVLFRGFPIREPADFQAVVKVWSPALLSYTYGSTPRSKSAVEGVYTSTEYPADQTIPQHNEMAYARVWPRYLWFYCETAAPVGGATPLADNRRVGERLDPALFASFAARGVRYVRNYGSGLDLSWQQAFETEDPKEVEELCRDQEIDFDWQETGRLRTSQRCPAVVEHPATGTDLWFNQAHLFHTSALSAEVRASLLELGPGQLPRQAYYGDGEPIEDAALDEVRAAFEAETVRQPWERGDVLLIDNMLVSHGRDPYEGPRRVLVAMTDEHDGRTGATR